MKNKKFLTAILLTAVLLVLCGCGKQAVNNDVDVTVGAQASAPVQEEPEKKQAEAESGSNDLLPADAAKTAVDTENATATPTEEPPSATPEPEAQSAVSDADKTETKPSEEEPTETTTPEERRSERAKGVNFTYQDIIAVPETVPAETEKVTEETLPVAESASEPEESTEETTLVVETSPEPGGPKREITIPAEYADVRYRIGEVKWNGDDSVTYRLTDSEYEQLLAEVHADIQSELDEMCASPFFPNFFSMTANEDCTVFTVVCLSIETSKAEQRSIPEVYELGEKYAAYLGTKPENIHIDYMTKIGNTFVTRDSEKDLKKAG